MTERAVRRPSMVGAVVSTVLSDVREMLRNPLAFFGGIGSTLLVCGLLVVGALLMGREASADESDEDELMIEFEPGTLVKLGIEPEEKEIPEKIITQETRAEEETTSETVTEDETEKPKDEPEPEPEEKPKKTPQKNPEKKDRKLPTAKNPTTKNTPYDDLPTVDYNIGNPFGDPKGWSDRLKKGDDWATAIMAELNSAGTMTAYAKNARGTYRFRLQLCPNGKIGKIQPKGGDVDARARADITTSLERLRVTFHRKVPPDVVKAMKGQCRYVKGTFVWQNGVVSFR
jgi:hypothetical protein